MITLKSILNDIEYDKLYEGLIKSNSYVSVFMFLDRNIDMVHFSQSKKLGVSGFIFKIIKNNLTIEKFKDILETIKNGYGWMAINFKFYDVNSGNTFEFTDYNDMVNRLSLKDDDLISIQVQMEAIHPVAIDKKHYPKHLYHVSPTKYKLKILKKGLIPKSMNKKFKHKDRVYFIDNSNFNSHKQLARLLSKYNDIDEWSVYEIDIKKVSNNFYLFKDNLTQNSYFTKNNIHKNIIKHVKDFKI